MTVLFKSLLYKKIYYDYRTPGIAMASTDFKDKLIKDYEDTPAAELPEAPLHALQGLSEKDAGRLEKAFNIHTIADLAELKYIHWAEEIVDLADSELADIPAPSLEDKLIKKYEKIPPRKLTRAPLNALQGLSKKDAELLEAAFRVKTVKGLAGLKYAQWAREMVAWQKKAEALMQQQDEPEEGRRAWKGVSPCKLVIGAIILFVLAMALYYGLSLLVGDEGEEPPSPATKIERQEKAAAEGEVKGEEIEGKSVDEPKTLPAETARKEDEPPGEKAETVDGETYTVQKGDSLVSISRHIYGTYEFWPRIYEANRESINRPWHIWPGMELDVPAVTYMPKEGVAGDGFYFLRLQSEAGKDGTAIQGVMVNRGEKIWDNAHFVIHVFDSTGKELGEKSFVISGFNPGEKKPFSARLEDIMKDSIKRYRIRFTGDKE